MSALSDLPLQGKWVEHMSVDSIHLVLVDVELVARAVHLAAGTPSCMA